MRLAAGLDGHSVEEASEVYGQGIVGGEFGSGAETIRRIVLGGVGRDVEEGS